MRPPEAHESWGRPREAGAARRLIDTMILQHSFACHGIILTYSGTDCLSGEISLSEVVLAETCSHVMKQVMTELTQNITGLPCVPRSAGPSANTRESKGQLPWSLAPAYSVMIS